MRLRRPYELTSADFPVKHRPFGDFEVIQPLLALCASGKLYEVEAWIAEGRPLQFPPSDDRKLQRRSTALQIAVNQRFHSLAALLLSNGYDPNGDYYECLSQAVHAKDLAMVDLLLQFGADPTVVDFCSVLETCERSLMDRFIEAGIDPCHGNAVARALGFKGRPVLGFIKQYRERFPCLQHQIDIALHVFTGEESLRGVALMLWLGADPHAETPSSAEDTGGETAVGESAFESAFWAKKPEILTQFLKRPIPPARAEKLFLGVAYRSRPDVVKRLLAAGADPNAVSEDGYPALHGFVHALLWRFSNHSAEEKERGIEALELVLKAGAKWKMDARQLKSLRRDLADGESQVVVQLLELLRQHAVLTPEELHELTRTPAVRKVLNGISKPRRDLFGHYSPPPVLVPTASVVEPPRRGYWKRHWSQR